MLRVLLFALSLGVATSAAQTPDGQIAGRLTDQAGGIIPGVRVTISSAAQSIQLVTDRDGRFALGSLPMGTYRVATELPGFMPASGEVKLEPSSPRAHLAWSLEIACQNEESRIIRTPRGAAPVVDAILHVRVTSVDGPVRISVRPQCPGRRFWDYSVQVVETAPVRGRSSPARNQIFTPVGDARLEVGDEYLLLVWPDGHVTNELVLPIISGRVTPAKPDELSGLPVADALKLLGTWSQEPRRQSPVPGFNAEWGAVLPADYFPKNMYTWCSREAPGRGGYWAPDVETIRALETALELALQAALNKEIKDPAGRPAAHDYYRQYFGIRIRGRQVVYVNGFHKRHLDTVARTRPALAESWRTRAVNVCDGGTRYFGAEYDPATRQVRNIRFNGRG